MHVSLVRCVICKAWLMMQFCLAHVVDTLNTNSQQAEHASQASGSGWRGQTLLSQHYRDQPSEDESDTSSRHGSEADVDHADSEGMSSDDEKDDASMELDDPFSGKASCSAHLSLCTR